MEKLRFDEVDKEIQKMLIPPGRAYWIVVSLLFLGVIYGYVVIWSYQILNGLGMAGYRPPCLGSVPCQFRLLDRHRPLGHSRLGNPLSVPGAMEHRYLPLRRGHDNLRRIDRGAVPYHPSGRPWVFYWLIPYPNQRYLWPNFLSPLVFDFLAVSTYITASLLFWYTGLVPDLATVRESVGGLRRKIYGVFSLGWAGTDRQWRHYGAAYLFLAALATPLVISVHSVVSWDFALAIIPGYHSTILPPYFVAGAIHSGLAMVLTLLIPLRRIFRLE